MAGCAGNYEKWVDVLFIGKEKCPYCGKEADYRLIRKVKFFRTVGRYIKCDSCGAMEEINRKDYKIIKSTKNKK